MHLHLISDERAWMYKRDSHCHAYYEAKTQHVEFDSSPISWNERVFDPFPHYHFAHGLWPASTPFKIQPTWHQSTPTEIIVFALSSSFVLNYLGHHAHGLRVAPTLRPPTLVRIQTMVQLAPLHPPNNLWTPSYRTPYFSAQLYN